MTTINKFDSIGKQNIKKNKLVTDFTENLDEKIERVCNFKYNNSLFYKIIHPFKTVKNSIEYSNLMSIKNDIQEIYDRNIMLFIDEESGNLEDDLEYASRMVKPKYMENYVKKLKLKK